MSHGCSDEVEAILRLDPGECREVPVGAADFRTHPLWGQVVACGLASASLVGEPGAMRLVLRRAADVPVPPPRPPSRCGVCCHEPVREVLRLPEMRVGVCPGCGAGLVLAHAAGVGHCEPDDYSERYTDESRQGKAQSCWDLLVDGGGGVRGAGSVLDIGCGAGAFLSVARDNGLETAGNELAPDAAAAAIGAGHEVLCCSAEQRAFAPGRRFDLVTMWDILEHLEQPRLAIANALDALAPGGRLVIATPMMGSAFDRWGVRLARVPGLRMRQLARMCWTRDHLYRFDRKGIADVLRPLGFSRITAAPVILLSLQADRYAGGRILRSWTGVPWVDGAISRTGVGLVRACKVANKVLVVAEKAGADGSCDVCHETRPDAMS